VTSGMVGQGSTAPDDEHARVWAEQERLLEGAGRRMPVEDGIIADTAAASRTHERHRQRQRLLATRTEGVQPVQGRGPRGVGQAGEGYQLLAPAGCDCCARRRPLAGLTFPPPPSGPSSVCSAKSNVSSFSEVSVRDHLSVVVASIDMQEFARLSALRFESVARSRHSCPLG
jgi:hypothetical protein